MSKPEAKLWWYPKTVGWVTWMGLFILLLMGIVFRFGIASDSLSQVIQVAALIVASIIILNLIYHRFLVKRRLEQRGLALREAAFAGDTSVAPLAEPQPVPDATALPLPYTIKTRRDWLGIVTICGAIALVVWVFFGNFLINFYAPDNLSGLFLTTTILALCFFGLFIPICAQVPRQWLEITNERLILYRGNFVADAVRWNEVKLFAIPTGGRQKKRASEYELLGSTGSFSLQRFQRKGGPQLSKPTLPFDEYDRQMDALLSVIAARTGLPLYDLR